MSESVNLTRIYSLAGGGQVSMVETVTNNAVLAIDVDCAVSTTTNVLASVTKANVVSMFIGVDNDAHVVSNSGTTYVMLAGVPILWSSSEPAISNPLPGNITSFNVVNASASNVVKFNAYFQTS